MPRYRENPLIVKFSLLCPGISQNTKHHHLTLYKGQVWREKSYVELCNHNVLNIVYHPISLHPGDIMVQSGELYLPPVPSWGFIQDETQIPFDSEILQSFAELTKITRITIYNLLHTKGSIRQFQYQLLVGSYECNSVHWEQCAPPHNYVCQYIWTKEGLKYR